LVSCGYSEAKNLSLVSKALVDKFETDPKDYFKLINPVSLEYEYLRISLIPSLVANIKLNPVDILKLFEIDKVYLKTSKGANEKYRVAGVSTGKDFRDFKTAIDIILSKLNIENYSIEFEVDKKYLHQSVAGVIKSGYHIIGEFGEISPMVLSAMEISEKVYCFEMDMETLEKLSNTKLCSSIPLNPPQIEDITLVLPSKTRVGEVMKAIKNSESKITNLELRDIYKDSYTFRIWYQDATNNLTDADVKSMRDRILTLLKSKFGISLKD